MSSFQVFSLRRLSVSFVFQFSHAIVEGREQPSRAKHCLLMNLKIRVRSTAFAPGEAPGGCNDRKSAHVRATPVTSTVRWQPRANRLVLTIAACRCLLKSLTSMLVVQPDAYKLQGRCEAYLSEDRDKTAPGQLGTKRCWQERTEWI